MLETYFSDEGAFGDAEIDIDSVVVRLLADMFS